MIEQRSWEFFVEILRFNCEGRRSAQIKIKHPPYLSGAYRVCTGPSYQILPRLPDRVMRITTIRRSPSGKRARIGGENSASAHPTNLSDLMCGKAPQTLN
ncbi:MAG: hypothetical protein WA322_25290 [Pseudolabrys sp.]